MTESSTPAFWSLAKREVLSRVLQSDPSLEYFLYVAGTAGPEAPLFVSIHGRSRNANEHARMFAPYAEALGVVLLAPRFDRDRFPDYQRLGREGRGGRADRALAAMIDEVAWLTGASVHQIYLFGYSGGAQFAHRFLMAYPSRVARAVIASAGWYTLPTAQRPFPYGIRSTKRAPGIVLDPEEFLRVPVDVLVGEEDEGEGEGLSLRHTERLDREQGRTRVERAHNWVAAMKEAARVYGIRPALSCEVLPRHRHSFRHFMERDRLGDRVFERLFGLPLRTNGEDGAPSVNAQGNGSPRVRSTA